MSRSGQVERVLISTAKSVVDCHHQVIMHAEHTKKTTASDAVLASEAVVFGEFCLFLVEFAKSRDLGDGE